MASRRNLIGKCKAMLPCDNLQVPSATINTVEMTWHAHPVQYLKSVITGIIIQRASLNICVSRHHLQGVAIWTHLALFATPIIRTDFLAMHWESRYQSACHFRSQSTSWHQPNESVWNPAILAYDEIMSYKNKIFNRNCFRRWLLFLGSQ